MQTPLTAPFSVAIVGGGIAGVTLALGLLVRRIPVTLYERADHFHETGAGIGMSPNAERAMLRLDPRIHAVFQQVATPNTEDWFQYVDGFNNSGQGDGAKLLFKMYLGRRGFEGCRRSDLIAGLVELIPNDCIKFQKDLISVVEPDFEETNDRVVLQFADGTSAEADIVLGCDGLRSRVRQVMLEADHLASQPSYTSKFAFRGLIPMQKARQALGDDRSFTRYMYLGPHAHVLTFPVAMGSLLNVAAFVSDSDDWPSKERLTLPASKGEAIQYFASFGPVVTSIMDLLPDKLDKWGLFDLHDDPLTSYASGSKCLVGDAAHGSSPHHGAGAGYAIEDSLALSVVLKDAASIIQQSSGSSRKQAALRVALSTYNDIRHERTQSLIQSSRYMGALYDWQIPELEGDTTKGLFEAEARCREIWDYDVDKMIMEARRLFATRTSRIDIL